MTFSLPRLSIPPLFLPSFDLLRPVPCATPPKAKSDAASPSGGGLRLEPPFARHPRKAAGTYRLERAASSLSDRKYVGAAEVAALRMAGDELGPLGSTAAQGGERCLGGTSARTTSSLGDTGAICSCRLSTSVTSLERGAPARPIALGIGAVLCLEKNVLRQGLPGLGSCAPLRKLPRWRPIKWETLQKQLERLHFASAVIGGQPLFESSLRPRHSLGPGLRS
jgi:hypothetical protein